jgi:hypothetical protein
MFTVQDLTKAFGRNTNNLKNQCKGLTHADSLCQPPVPGNCLNWVVGHVVNSRDSVLGLLGAPKLTTEAQAKRYGYGSEPVCGEGPDLITLEDALALLEKGEAAIAAALSAKSEAELSREVQSFAGLVTVAQFVFLLYGHETYHVGQTEILRELALANKG